MEAIRSMLTAMGDGEITVSAYDTAWVALVPSGDGSGEPQFPASVTWIARNQLHDGSWGDPHIFSAHDRLINTLAAVVALKRWDLYPHKCLRGMYRRLCFFFLYGKTTLILLSFFGLGMSFFKENIGKLENENPEHMPIGFEVAFPSLLEMARKLNLDVPFDSPVLRQIYSMRDIKLTK